MGVLTDIFLTMLAEIIQDTKEIDINIKLLVNIEYIKTEMICHLSFASVSKRRYLPLSFNIDVSQQKNPVVGVVPSVSGK